MTIPLWRAVTKGELTVTWDCLCLWVYIDNWKTNKLLRFYIRCGCEIQWDLKIKYYLIINGFLYKESITSHIPHEYFNQNGINKWSSGHVRKLKRGDFWFNRILHHLSKNWGFWGKLISTSHYWIIAHHFKRCWWKNNNETNRVNLTQPLIKMAVILSWSVA